MNSETRLNILSFVAMALGDVICGILAAALMIGGLLALFAMSRWVTMLIISAICGI